MNQDVLIIGAGVLGLSSAYHIKKQNPEKRVLVIDQFGGPGQGNTAKSAGGFRNVFASETNYVLADTTIDWLFHLQNNLGYDLKLHRIGYLWLFSEHQYLMLKGALEKMQKMGIELRILCKEDLEQFIPALVTDINVDEEGKLMGLDPIDYGVLGVKCGTVNTDALARSYEDLFLRQGGQVRYGVTATRLNLKPEEELGIPGEPFIWQDSTVVGAETSQGAIHAGTTVVATGAWSERLLNPIGFDAMMRPKKRVMFVFQDSKLKELTDIKGFNDQNVLPMTHIPTLRIYIKPDLTERSVWMSCADDFGRKYGLEDDPQPEENLYRDNLYYALVKYLPCFENVRPDNMWAGQRAINRFDTMPVVAPVSGMIYVGAATGNGILKCDALGRVASALYAGEGEAELYENRPFKAANLGVLTRNVERETFHVG